MPIILTWCWYSLFRYPNRGLGDHNYCRNPAEYYDRVWCYTTSGTRWDYCNVPICGEFNILNNLLVQNNVRLDTTNIRSNEDIRPTQSLDWDSNQTTYKGISFCVQSRQTITFNCRLIKYRSSNIFGCWAVSLIIVR